MSCSESPFDDPQFRALGWSEHFAAAWPAHAAPAVRPGRVVRVDRGLVRVRTTDAHLDADPSPVGPDGVCTGDWVAVHTADDRNTVVGVLPRLTALCRAAADGRSQGQALAANADTVALVEPLVPDPDLTRTERLLVLLWETGATPLVVLTKADLVPEVGRWMEQIAAIAPGVEVVAVSSATGEGFEALSPHVAPGRTLALVGRSGAGKSTLSNRLVGDEVLEVRTIREVDGKGRHTTVRRELLLIPGGGAVIDTPGLRAAGLWAVDEGVERVFPDVEELAEQCRFADCAHSGESGCAVAGAVADGRLSERRLESWRKLGREAEWIASRTDARLRQERERYWKRIHIQMRRSGRNRP